MMAIECHSGRYPQTRAFRKMMAGIKNISTQGVFNISTSGKISGENAGSNPAFLPSPSSPCLLERADLIEPRRRTSYPLIDHGFDLDFQGSPCQFYKEG